ncbi:histidine kinase [Microbulbifer agarilyticus]|uniref:sensor histidine kinase n=1 Tax=Microbulbifer agarilyticus TaxID=260552 RepID=UPI001C94E200|nr:histidine kinase [Microbulbifer agarilyticus]MBY6191868.1 histidine kinase [Microbulbifer agarilyticus]MBY6212811.1 histidine kinase [Microbulbifer agarilyticus]
MSSLAPPQKQAEPSAIQSQHWFIKLQLVSWSGILVITFLSVSAWSSADSGAAAEPLNTLFQCGIGVLLSLFLKPIFDVAWYTPIALRTFFYLLAIAVIAGIWTVVRMETNQYFLGGSSLWPEFGGWYYASLFTFLFWSALYCGVKYFLLLQEEHKLVLKVAAIHEQEQLKRVHAESIAKEAQLKMLRYQLNPHFLFNTLNSINALIRIKHEKQAQDMVLRLSQFLRLSLTEAPLKKVSLSQEIKAVQLYLDIERTRFADRLRVEVDIEMNASESLVPSMLLQPIAENAIKYAIAQSVSGGTIAIRAKVDQNRLHIEVCDTGTSSGDVSDEECDIESTGVGLSNVQDRLTTLYGNDFYFTQSQKPSGGLIVTLNLPNETAEETQPEVVSWSH